MSDSVEIYQMPADIAHLEAPPFVKVVACSVFMNVLKLKPYARHHIAVHIALEDLANPWGLSEEMVEMAVRWLTDIGVFGSYRKYSDDSYGIKWGKPVPQLHFAKAYSHNPVAENTGTEPF